MRRRTFIAATATATLLPTAVACQHSRPNTSATPAPTPPPKPDAIPTAFTDTPTWPTINARTTITAVHDHYLCAEAEIKEALTLVTK